MGVYYSVFVLPKVVSSSPFTRPLVQQSGKKKAGKGSITVSVLHMLRGRVRLNPYKYLVGFIRLFYYFNILLVCMTHMSVSDAPTITSFLQ